MKKLIIILALLTWGCSSSRIIKSKHGPVHKHQLKHITEYFEFDDYGRKIHHRNDKGILTVSLTWGDIQILNIDSLTFKYLEYNCNIINNEKLEQ